jgi:hypothetical protein
LVERGQLVDDVVDAPRGREPGGLLEDSGRLTATDDINVDREGRGAASERISLPVECATERERHRVLATRPRRLYVGGRYELEVDARHQEVDEA